MSIFALAGCGASFTHEDFDKENMINISTTYEKEIIGKSVEFIGKVKDASTPTEEGQLIWFLPPVEKEEQYLEEHTNVPVRVHIAPDSGMDFIENDYNSYYKVTAIIDGLTDETDPHGVDVITAVGASIEKVTASSVESPTLVLDDKPKTITIKGVEFTIDKMEYSPVETRMFVTINNKSNGEADFYEFKSYIVADGVMLESGSDYYGYEEELPKAATNLKAGTTTTGVFKFPALDIENAKKVLYTMEATGDSYSDDLVYKFNLK